MTEDREPVYVRCRACKHEWIGMYLPLNLTLAMLTMQGLRCPNCANDSAMIFIKGREVSDG